MTFSVWPEQVYLYLKLCSVDFPQRIKSEVDNCNSDFIICQSLNDPLFKIFKACFNSILGSDWITLCHRHV